jgi:hypothetical protein
MNGHPYHDAQLPKMTQNSHRVKNQPAHPPNSYVDENTAGALQRRLSSLVAARANQWRP